MATTVARSPARLAGTDLGGRQAIWLGFAAMAVVTALDLIDGRLSILFSLGFVLVVLTLPMAVHVGGLFPTGVLPPVLLVATLTVVAIFWPEAIVVDGMPADTGSAGRVLAGTIDRGVTLMVGHGLAIVVIVLRILTAPGRRRR